jgi:hypothetical protein
MKTKLSAVLLTALLSCAACFGATKNLPADTSDKAAASDQKTVPAKKPAQSHMTEGYLGIAIEPLHSPVVERVERLFGEGQGVAGTPRG